ncbi:MAG: iron-sulfur cluster carrier protein ApbC [Azoarcus sp.]|jgi:ATP-binding protein involved in chromosome partitioning|nr:iron-sulfur cluster carrier protein ApbC [Azoarcus sp.]
MNASPQSLSVQDVTGALQTVADPGTGKDFVSTHRIRGLVVEGGAVRFKVEPGYPALSQHEAIRNRLAAAVHALPGVERVEIGVSGKIAAHAVKNGVRLLPGVKNIIAVASGKGGVGKSTTAANLALALAAEGARVGMLDADIYGPSQPQMLGIAARRPESPDGKTMEPIEAHGLQVMSIGLLVDDDTPMVWRGPLATRALTQLLTETRWRDLDYLVVDLPPGTGDIQLTLAQNVPVTGAVIVTTPQDIALIDAKKGLKMFEKVNVPILGVVENMSIHICSRCGHEEHIFGAGGGQRICDDYGVAFLGALPLDLKIRAETDAGSPTVVADPASRIAAIYREIACKTAVAIAGTARDMSHKFPQIVVQNG